MHVTEGVYTRKVAAEVAAGIKYLIEHPGDDRYLDLKLVRYSSKRSDDWTERIRLIDEVKDQVLARTNQRGELVRCVTDAGQRLDILFGNPSERDLEPALVLFVEA